MKHVYTIMASLVDVTADAENHVVYAIADTGEEANRIGNECEAQEHIYPGWYVESMRVNTRNNTRNDKVKFVCEECGSDNVRKNADTAWDVEEQEWSIVDLFDNTTCEDCGCERRLEEVTIE